MDGITIILTISGIIISSIITLFVSKYFFKKSIKEKSFTPFIQFTSTLFSELDPELQKNLKVNYKNHKIDNITQAQFVIANTGDVPIRDIIKPLRLSLPVENKIFSVNIIYTEPKEREVDYHIIESDDSNIIEFKIPLLNAREYFVVKILIQDVLNDSEKDKINQNVKYNFSITADDLPPHLNVRNLPSSYYEKGEEKDTDGAGLVIWTGVISLILFISIIGTIYSFKYYQDCLYLFSLKEFFGSGNFSFFHICVIFLFLFSLFSFLLVISALIGTIATAVRTKKQNLNYQVR